MTQLEITVRGLEIVEIPTWAQFCAACFSHKKPNPPPSSYFQRHFDNDPNKEVSLIRVAVKKHQRNDAPETNCEDGNPNLVSSVRVFLRKLSTGEAMKESGGKLRNAGGIGEVCTLSQYRRQGIASRLLKDAVMQMGARNLDCSLLHVSNPALQAVYKKQGYASVCTSWSNIPMRISFPSQEEFNDDYKYFIQIATFEEDQVTRMSAIHKAYSEERFAGCVIRSIAYWREYLSEELNDQMHVLYVLPVATNDSAPFLCAWLSIRKRGTKFQIREFGVDQNILTSSDALQKLLPVALSSVDINDNGGSKNEAVDMNFPTFLLKEIKESSALHASFDWENIENVDDYGWMYKELNTGNDSDIKSMVELCKTATHFIWPSDSF